MRERQKQTKTWGCVCETAEPGRQFSGQQVMGLCLVETGTAPHPGPASEQCRASSPLLSDASVCSPPCSWLAAQTEQGLSVTEQTAEGTARHVGVGAGRDCRCEPEEASLLNLRVQVATRGHGH